MHPALIREIEQGMDVQVATARFMQSGNRAAIYLLELRDGRDLIVKTAEGAPDDMLPSEGSMLHYLSKHGLPVPTVYLTSPRLLVMEPIEHDSKPGEIPQEDLAEILAALHGHTASLYGLAQHTYIGSLPQPNPQESNWIGFFTQHRLRYMARLALEEKRIDISLMHRIDRLLPELPELIGQPAPPSLIHGDLWSGNILCADGRITGFIDPAIYYADPEIELAFGTLFGTFSDRFFQRYNELRPIREGFFETRCDLYNLYPLLVHVRLFGGSYTTAVEKIVSRFVR